MKSSGIPSLLTNIAMLSVLSGCTWISDEQYTKELVNVDEDGDGVTIQEGDCNDQMPNVSPLLEEVWYDGIDGDCGGDNDFDKDKDGFVPTEHQGKMTTAHGVEVAPLPGGDCNDEDPDSFPGADDEFYDGVDSDCRGNDDYDQDGDEFVSDEYVGLTTANIDSPEALPGGDCNDVDASVNPGEIDNWYDGVDSDCGGENDYDRDGDGVAYELIDANTDVGGLERGDCDDQDAAIFPGQAEVWYDGIDSDCGEDDDYDQDGDGYVPTEYQGERTTGLNGTGNLPGGDCDDLNPLRYEGASEIMSDPMDYDCDLCIGVDCSQDSNLGGTSATITESPWLLYGTGSNPENIRITSNDDSIFVSSRAMDVATTNPINGTTINYYSASYVAAFDLGDVSTDPSEFFRWRGKTDSPDSNPYSDVQSVVANNQFFIGAIGQEKLNSAGQGLYRYLRISVKQLTQTFYFHLSSRTTNAAPALEDVSVLIDSNDVIHAVGCESTTGILQYARLPLSALQPGSSVSMDAEAEISDMYFSKCKLTEDPSGEGILWAENNGVITPHTFDMTALEENLAFTPQADLPFEYPGVSEWTLSDTTFDAVSVFTEPTGVYALIDGNEYHVSTTPDPLHAYGSLSPTGELIVTVINTQGEGSVLIGDPSTFTSVTPTLDSFDLTTDLSLTELAPYAYVDTSGQDKLFLAFLGLDGILPKMGFATLTR